MDLAAAHRHSSGHRIEILASSRCGCFHCKAIFSPDEIREWMDETEQSIGQTALCPSCGVDAVLGSASGLPLSEDFLGAMHDRWFSSD
jgi:hypothetical protein